MKYQTGYVVIIFYLLIILPGCHRDTGTDSRIIFPQCYIFQPDDNTNVIVGDTVEIRVNGYDEDGYVCYLYYPNEIQKCILQFTDLAILF